MTTHLILISKNMKSLMLICLLLTGAIQTYSQTAINPANIPAVLKDKMNESYPEAKGIYWEQPMPGFIDANFTLDKKKCTATFTPSGAWVSTDFEIDATTFPDSAVHYLMNKEGATKITRYYRNESKAKGIQYSADAKVDGKTFQYIFDKEGGLIMKAKKD